MYPLANYPPTLHICDSDTTYQEKPTVEHTITFSIEFNPNRNKPFQPRAFRGTGGIKDLGVALERCGRLNSLSGNIEQFKELFA